MNPVIDHDAFGECIVLALIDRQVPAQELRVMKSPDHPPLMHVGVKLLSLTGTTRYVETLVCPEDMRHSPRKRINALIDCLVSKFKSGEINSKLHLLDCPQTP